MPKLRPLLCTLALLLAAITLVSVVIERPLAFTAHRAEKIAAIALRDNVSPFEKRGSALFTIPYLKKFYGRFTYLEAEQDWVTPGEFCPHAEKLLQQSDSLDVFILSHGNVFYEWFSHMDTALRKRVRLVYNTGCNNDSQCVAYKKRDARFYVGHTGENSLSPVFYVYFLRRLFWSKNIPAAVEAANSRTERVLSMFISDKDTIRGSTGNYHDLRK